jgi:transposase
MTMLAEVVDAVIGIDTHRDSHEVEIADAAGRPIATMQVSNDSGGFAQLLATLAKVVPGPRVAVCIEGSRSYGIGLARAPAAAGLLVIECEQPSRKQRRGKGKSDPIDAHLAVLAALRLDTGRVPVPRADGDREALRIVLVARQEITAAATGQASRLRALLLAGDDTDRQAARKTLSKTALAALAGREPPAGREHAVRQAEIARLALALRQAREQLKDNRAQLLAIVDDIAPGLTSRYGVGPVSAAQAIVSFSHPGRCRSEAAFAALGGTSPIPASSGRTIRHRLNRGGGRALNRAIHAIALTRMRSCPRTRAYVARRTAEGKTVREIRRCLKRYIARELYRQLHRSMKPLTNP